MKALFAFSGKYDTYEGEYYSNGLPASTWQERYLNIFDCITVVGREQRAESVKGKNKSSCKGVLFHCTTIGLNPIEFFTKRKELENLIADEVKKVDFVIARLALFGAIAAKYAKKYHKPYICEVVGSAWDDNWNYSFMGKMVAPYFEWLVKKTVKDSQYTIYVTQNYLQKEYPTKGKSIGISNVYIKRMDETVLTRRMARIDKTDCKKMVFCTIAAVNVRYKGQVYMFEAMKKLKGNGIQIKYILIGGGDQTYLQKKAEEYGVSDAVTFTGPIEHKWIFEHLDHVDVYIQPSLQEGLPRAMIEALSRGLPAMGFRTAGIPELISNEFVCRRKSVNDICRCILRLNNQKMKEAAAANFEMAKSFEFSTLNKKREMFIKEAMESK